MNSMIFYVCDYPEGRILEGEHAGRHFSEVVEGDCRLERFDQDGSPRLKVFSQESNPFSWMLENSIDAIVILREDGGVYTCNLRHAEMLGYRREEMLGLHFWDWDARWSKKELLALLGRPNRGSCFQGQWKCKDGQILDVEVCSNDSLYQGRRYIAMVCRDITERLRAEAFRDAQDRILEQIASGESLRATLGGLVLALESQLSKVRCSILVLEEDSDRFGMVVAPSMSEHYATSLVGLRIGAEVGTCGKAAYCRETVISEDLMVDPNWAPFRELARLFQLRSCWSVPIMDARGVVLGTFAVYRDRTGRPLSQELATLATVVHLAGVAISRWRSEQALQANVERLDLALNSARMGVWEWDFESGALSWSSSVCALFQVGQPPNHVRHLRDLVPQADLDRFLAEVDRAAREQTSFRSEFRLHRAALTWVEVMGLARYDEQGQAVGMLGTVQDVSERKRDQEAVVQIVEGAIDAVVTVDEQGQVQLWNREAERIFGFSAAEMLGQPLTPMLTLPAVGQRVETTALRREGREFPAEVAVISLREGLSTVFVRDLTERTRLESQLRQSQKMEALGTLAGGIAHDFNNILSVMLGNADLAAMELSESHPVQELLSEITKAGFRARNLVRQILTYSRRQPLEQRRLDLREVVFESVRLLRASLPANVRVESRQPDHPTPVLADPALLQQVLLNLGTNAWHALEGQPGRISLAVEVEGEWVCVSVEDTGKGIEKALLERIFEPFFTTKGPNLGTGLGLSVVEGIVASHRGQVQVQSQVGQGTTFRILLPLFQEESQEPVPERLMPGRRQRILFVDDEQPLLKVTARLLEEMGYAVEAFHLPQEALDVLRRRPNDFALVLSDLNMPKVSGIDLCRGVRELGLEIPFVLESGNITDEARADGEKLGVTFFVEKPADSKTLQLVLQKALR